MNAGSSEFVNAPHQPIGNPALLARVIWQHRELLYPAWRRASLFPSPCVYPKLLLLDEVLAVGDYGFRLWRDFKQTLKVMNM